MEGADSLEDTAMALVNTAMDLVDCDHGGYTEVDVHFGRTRFFSSEPEIADWMQRKSELWHHFMPVHPVLKHRTENPDVTIVRLSDVTDLSSFYKSGLYNELFREVETDHQLAVHLGFDPKNALMSRALPLTLGVPLNRSGMDFSDRDLQVLSLMQKLARPILRRKRAIHQFRLLDAAELSPELGRSFVRLGLSPRQAEVAFWMLKGKSNTDIGVILEVKPQTVRQHSIEIYSRLGLDGRLALQRAVFRTVAGLD